MSDPLQKVSSRVAALSHRLKRRRNRHHVPSPCALGNPPPEGEEEPLTAVERRLAAISERLQSRRKPKRSGGRKKGKRRQPFWLARNREAERERLAQDAQVPNPSATASKSDAHDTE